MVDVEFRPVLLVLMGGLYFFLVLPLLTFHLRRILRGIAMGVFLGALGVWFLAHLLLAFGAPWAQWLLILSAVAIGIAILDLARHYARLIAEEDGGAGQSPPVARKF